MEDADGRLSVSERSVPTIDWKTKNPMAMIDAELEILDRKALGTIRLCLTTSVAFNILKETTTEGLIKVLAKLYEKPSASKKVFLMKRLFNMKMLEGGYVANHLNEFNTVTSQLSSVGTPNPTWVGVECEKSQWSPSDLGM